MIVLSTACSIVEQILKQTSDFDSDNGRALCLDYTIFSTSFQTKWNFVLSQQL